MDWSLLVLKILLTGILFVILSIICVLLVARIRQTLAVKHTREHIVKLSNQGNFTSIFSLSVVAVEKMFRFKLLLNDIPLVAAPQSEILQPFPVDANAAPSEPSAQNRVEKKTAITKTETGINTAVKGGQAVAAKAGLAASFIGTLASLLPGSMGSSLRAQSETLRQTQANAQTASQAPANAQRRVESLQQQGGRLTGGKPAAAAGGNPSPPNTRQPEANSSSAPAPSQSSGRSNSTVVKKTVAPGVYKVQTQPVEPGAELSLVLRIEASKRSRPDGTYAYTLSSLQLPVEALEGEQPPVVKQGILHYPHVNFWRYWLAPVVNLLVIAIFLFALILTFRFIWY